MVVEATWLLDKNSSSGRIFQAYLLYEKEQLPFYFLYSPN